MSDDDQGHRPRRFTEQSLKAIVDVIPAMIWVKDANDLRFVLFNKGAEELLGVCREQLLGKSDYDLFSPEQADAFVARDREVLAGRVVDDEAEKINTPNGVRTLLVKRYVIVEDGKPRYILGISQDIT
jgi:PAS domain S-box-containing protein